MLKRSKRTVGTGITAKDYPIVNLDAASPTEAADVLGSFLDSQSQGFEGQAAKDNENICWNIIRESGFQADDVFDIDLEAAGVEEHSREWYARQILVELHVARDRSRRGDIDRAMLSAFKIGVLVAEANLKFAWETHALRGLKSETKGRLGAAMVHGDEEAVSRRRRERLAAFEAQLAAQGGRNVTGAMEIVAERFGVSRRTIQRDREAIYKS